MIYQWFTVREDLRIGFWGRTLFPFAHQVHTVWADYSAADSIL
jgi:hypothetical protein